MDRGLHRTSSFLDKFRASPSSVKREELPSAFSLSVFPSCFVHEQNAFAYGHLSFRTPGRRTRQELSSAAGINRESRARRCAGP
ncbi:hypothetical protein B8V81_3091 [Paenibacillus pasadenensis]|uniref:Uncharacterized protein n=1 Tax=Paenibacillus pasadenensis TaxID=217090 RepID=A0A2N5N2V4_9BACL|nr:hypothetical protein B8V81_3091 [Paenibacillus pasadenensis]